MVADYYNISIDYLVYGEDRDYIKEAVWDGKKEQKKYAGGRNFRQPDSAGSDGAGAGSETL